MRLGLLSPGRATRRARAVCLTAVVLIAAACTLNQGPDNQTVSGGPPVVRLTSPLPNATYLEGVAVNIQAYVSNAGPDIDRVEVTVDNAIVQKMPSPNPSGAPVFSLTYSWSASGVGPHRVGVTAFRASGAASQPATETFTVISRSSIEEPTDPPPTVAPTQSGDA